jgi:hypothetical protein
MRHLAFILSFYLFALNLAPCADYVTSDNYARTEISQAVDDHQHQGVDLCSPFCICQCCHTSVTQFQVSNIKFEINFISTQDFFYLNGIEKEFTTSILQPPRA